MTTSQTPLHIQSIKGLGILSVLWLTLGCAIYSPSAHSQTTDEFPMVDRQTLQVTPPSSSIPTRTLQQYVHKQLQNETLCCGSDSILVEVDLTPDGHSTAIRPLTGRNPCYKQSIVDTLKGVRWTPQPNATATEHVRFEIKMTGTCSGLMDENLYEPLPIPASKNPPFQPPADPPPNPQDESSETQEGQSPLPSFIDDY